MYLCTIVHVYFMKLCLSLNFFNCFFFFPIPQDFGTSPRHRPLQPRGAATVLPGMATAGKATPGVPPPPDTATEDDSSV